MSDSDSELLSNNAFPFRNETLAFSVRGPSVNMDLTGFSYRNNVHSSTMHTSRYHGWQRPTESSYSQRSVGYRRETSPMSTISACDARLRNFNSFYARGMSSQRSENGRGTSPMSARSIASNTSRASALNMAIKKLQSMDVISINNTINFMNNNKKGVRKTRSRIDKRRKLFIKHKRRKSGYDSGDLGSNSSISSDDNSPRHHRNMSSCRSTYTDVSNVRSTIKEVNMFTDYTNNHTRNLIRNHEQVNDTIEHSSRNMMVNTRKPAPASTILSNTASQSTITLKDRFRNRFELPSQRFYRTVRSSIPEVSEHPSEIIKRHTQARSEPSLQQDVSSEEEIFSEITAIERPTNLKKRSCDDDIHPPIIKRIKKASPCNELKSFKKSTAIKNDFEFTKPALPVKKPANPKVKEKVSNPTYNTSAEKLIAKSAAPLSDNIIQAALPIKSTSSQPYTVDEVVTESRSDQTMLQNTDVSMRPSFIKRKLFTQNMDVAENNNDVSAVNSPQSSIYGAILKEKHKARKLVTSQYCLSRDIQPDDNNIILDLIHKIVPAEKMNATNQTNRTMINNNTNNNKSLREEDKCNDSSIVITRNGNDSDTFTDEEILNDKKLESPKIMKRITNYLAPNVQAPQKVLFEKNGTLTKPVKTSLKSFWDTDFESTDDEAVKPVSKKTNLNENQRIDNLDKTTAQEAQGFLSIFPVNKMVTSQRNDSVMDSTKTSELKFNKSSKSFKLFSHRTVCKPIPKKVSEKKEDTITQMEPQNKKQQTMRANREIDSSMIGKENAHLKAKPQKDLSTPQPKNKTTPLKKQNTRKLNDATPKVSNTIKKPIKENRKQTYKKTDDVLEKSLSNKKSEINHHNKPPKKVPVAVPNKSQINEVKLENKASAPKHKILYSNKSDATSRTQNKNKTDSVQKDTTKMNTRNKANASKLSDSMIVEDVLSDTNNTTANSRRPIRTCRILKQNETISRNSLNMTLRSRSSEKKIMNKKEIEKLTMYQSDKSEVSLSLVSDKKAVNKKWTNLVNSRLLKTNAIDTSEISFSLPIDKDTPPTKGRNSARNKITADVKILSPTNYNKMNLLSKRNIKPNRRYLI